MVFKGKGLALMMYMWSVIATVNGQSGVAGGSLRVAWQVSQWEKVPDFVWQDTSGNNHALIFASESYKGKDTKVFAYYSNPDIYAQKAPSGRKFPAIVLVHGGSGRAFPQWVEQWAKAGYAAIAMDLTGRGADEQRLDEAGPPMTAETMFLQIETEELHNMWTYHSVASVIIAHSLLRSFPEVDEQRIGLTGVSWGGYLTALVSALDHRFMAAVPVYGCGYIGESDIFSDDLAKLTPMGRTKWLAAFDPSVYMANIGVPVLFINGNKDRFYNVVPHAKSVALVNRRTRYLCIKPDLPHSYEAAWELDEIQTFFDNVRHGEFPFFPQVTAMKIGPSGVEAVFQLCEDTPMQAAYFYYTSDTTSSNEKRVWSRVDAVLLGSTVAVQLPREAYAYGFFHFCIGGSQSFSSSLIF